MTRYLLIAACLTMALAAEASPWDDYAPYARHLSAIDPTPSGDGHMGIIESGKTVQLRFPVPAEAVVAYRVNVGSIVAYTGKGQSYQLVLRVDKADGPVVYEGPVIPDGDAWNASNREPIDLTKAIKPERRKQGYIDLYVTGLVTGDGWTFYKHSAGRQTVAQAVVLTSEMQRQIEMGKQMAARGLAILPQPQRCELREGEVTLTGFARAAKSASERFLYGEINGRVKELGQAELKLDTKAGRVWLCVVADKVAVTGLRKIGFAAKPSGHAQGYTLEVQKAGVAIVGDDEAGLFYGVQTLRQLMAGAGTAGRLIAGPSNGPRVPAVLITDWPDYPLRGWQYDIARGQTINLDFCQRLIRESARHKMNCIMLYMEGDFIFEKYPFVGRAGTLDKQKALALDAYAAQYHLQLIPQYEALGHASATLQHDELKDLRENGSTWVYCTSEPKTWQFLDDVFGELAAAFPHCTYFHVGADEFEGGFALCPSCQPKGIGPCYVEHMTKLNNICQKYGRKMLFWPSHQAERDEISYLSLKYAKDMPKDCIPTEWIYHGPASYPEIAQYQQAGYEDVFVSPAVVDYSVIWPDYVTSFRGIKGFYDAGRRAAKPCGGAICTTWELMYGGLYENSWYGIIYAAECGRSLGKTSKSDYDRRFAADWFGITDPGATPLIAKAFYEPIPATGDAAIWRSGKLVKDLLWCPPQDFRRRFMLREPVYLQKAEALDQATIAWAESIATLGEHVTRNWTTIEYGLFATDVYDCVVDKLVLLDRAAREYAAAREYPAVQKDLNAAYHHKWAAEWALQELSREIGGLKDGFREAIRDMGAYTGDLDAIGKQVEGTEEMLTKLRRAQLGALPPAEELGLGLKPFTKVANWDPSQMSEADKELRWDLTPFIKSAGTYRFEFEYARGAHGLKMRDVRLLCDGQVMTQDNHAGWAGSGSSGNIFTLKLDQYEAGQKYELAAIINSAGGTDSRGDIWLSVD
jgi:hypothetical protein